MIELSFLIKICHLWQGLLDLVQKMPNILPTHMKVGIGTRIEIY